MAESKIFHALVYHALGFLKYKPTVKTFFYVAQKTIKSNFFIEKLITNAETLIYKSKTTQDVKWK
jgi:hypothetical protein